MGYAGGGTIPDALNRTEHHAAIEEAFRKNIPIAAKAGGAERHHLFWDPPWHVG